MTLPGFPACWASRCHIRSGLCSAVLLRYFLLPWCGWMCGLEGRVRQLDVALLVRIQLYIYRIDLIFVGCCGGAPAVVIGLRCRCDGPLLVDIAYAIACSCARHSGWSFGVLLTAADGVHPVPELQPSHAGTTNHERPGDWAPPDRCAVPCTRPARRASAASAPLKSTRVRGRK